MPVYEYTCQDCHTQFEVLVRSMQPTLGSRCPNCGGDRVKKDWSRFGVGRARGAPAASAPPSAPSCAPAGT